MTINGRNDLVLRGVGRGALDGGSSDATISVIDSTGIRIEKLGVEGGTVAGVSQRTEGSASDDRVLKSHCHLVARGPGELGGNHGRRCAHPCGQFGAAGGELGHGISIRTIYGDQMRHHVPREARAVTVVRILDGRVDIVQIAAWQGNVRRAAGHGRKPQ